MLGIRNRLMRISLQQERKLEFRIQKLKFGTGVAQLEKLLIMKEGKFH